MPNPKKTVNVRMLAAAPDHNQIEPRAADMALIDSFLDRYWGETGASTNTLASYRLDLIIFARWLSANSLPNLAEVSRAQVLDFLAYRSSGGKSARTGARTLSTLKTFYGQDRKSVV